MNNIYPVLFFFLLLLFSCQKDELQENALPLVGKWQWQYTTDNVQKNPVTENYKCELEISEKIELILRKNDKEIDRIWFSITDLIPLSFPYEGFYFEAKIKSNMGFKGELYHTLTDSLILYGDFGFPFPGKYYDSFTGLTDHKNIFLKTN